MIPTPTTVKKTSTRRRKYTSPAPLPKASEYVEFYSESAALQASRNPIAVNDAHLPPAIGSRLSNFSLDNVEYGGIVFPSVEHAFQAQKFTCLKGEQPRRDDLVARFSIYGEYGKESPRHMKALTTFANMRTTFQVAIDRAQWTVTKRKQLMMELICSKVQRHFAFFGPVLRAALQHHIRFVHFSRFDMFWGCNTKKNPKTQSIESITRGKNKLGELYNLLTDAADTISPNHINRTIFQAWLQQRERGDDDGDGDGDGGNGGDDKVVGVVAQERITIRRRQSMNKKKRQV